jgi:hypothetical protein
VLFASGILFHELTGRWFIVFAGWGLAIGILVVGGLSKRMYCRGLTRQRDIAEDVPSHSRIWDITPPGLVVEREITPFSLLQNLRVPKVKTDTLPRFAVWVRNVVLSGGNDWSESYHRGAVRIADNVLTVAGEMTAGVFGERFCLNIELSRVVDVYRRGVTLALRIAGNEAIAWIVILGWPGRLRRLERLLPSIQSKGFPSLVQELHRTERIHMRVTAGIALLVALTVFSFSSPLLWLPGAMANAYVVGFYFYVVFHIATRVSFWSWLVEYRAQDPKIISNARRIPTTLADGRQSRPADPTSRGFLSAMNIKIVVVCGSLATACQFGLYVLAWMGWL